MCGITSSGLKEECEEVQTGFKGGVILLLAVIILGLAWAAFLFYQNQDHIQENHAAEYFLSALSVLALLLVATGLGSLLSGSAGRPGSVLIACALGLAVLGLGVFGLAAAGLLSRASVWVLVALLGGLSARRIARLLTRAGALGPAERPGWLTACFLLIIALGLIACLISCLAPLTANDSLVYHLNIPRIYLSEGGMARLPHNAYANMPHNGEILYTMAYAAAGETGAKLFYFAARGDRGSLLPGAAPYPGSPGGLQCRCPACLLLYSGGPPCSRYT
jgi:hypothetical protein